MKRRIRLALAGAMIAAAVVPALVRGDVVQLVDGSTIRGRVVRLGGDTLVVRTSFGTAIRIPRGQLRAISFGDSTTVPRIPAATLVPRPGGGRSEVREPRSGDGKIAVTFVDRGVSSKITAKNRNEYEEVQRANWVVQRFLVDGDVVFAATDSSTDKTIYKGRERQFKNDVELQDFEVEVPAGLHHCMIAVTTTGADSYEGRFDPEPLRMSLNLDNLEVYPGQTVRVRVGLNRGRLRLGTPRLYRKE